MSGNKRSIQRGVVSLWRYTESDVDRFDWNLSADAAGIDFLLDMLSEMDFPDAFRTIRVRAPSSNLLQIANFKGGRALWESPSKWKIKFKAGAENGHLWRVTRVAETLCLQLGSEHMKSLRDGVTRMKQGDGDFSLDGYSRDDDLWFWWSEEKQSQ